ncbi:hypothetical protein SAY87_009200 [Trapa incisa]|uniref:Uncharacterized protein n=1 Tax=Trapa incisa TaxID=236973 RepID=A0AAN7JVB0_9MYRT|nr:hypothetical protein SAY87_009200 [Trapa incisa]
MNLQSFSLYRGYVTLSYTHLPEKRLHLSSRTGLGVGLGLGLTVAAIPSDIGLVTRSSGGGGSLAK